MQIPAPLNRITSIAKPILFCILFTGLLALVSPLKNIFPAVYERFAYGIIGSLLAWFLTWIFLRIDKKPFSAIGLRWEAGTLKRFIAGFFIGIAITGIIITSLIFFTDLKLELSANNTVTRFLLMSLALIPLAFMEEMAFRAYPFFNLKSVTGIRVTQIIIAILFALYHFAGGQSLFSSFMGPGIWAFVFGLALVMSGGISLPTGLHVGANFLLAAIGQHPGIGWIWTIKYRTDMTAGMEQHTENAGNMMQIVLLITTLVVMEWRIRSIKSGKNGETTKDI